MNTTENSTKDFSQLLLIEPLQKALKDSGYTTPTPIQTAAIPSLLIGRDLLGCAQTGTGKTAAFALPILQALHKSNKRPSPRHTRALILVPTRELAVQVEESFRTYGKYLRLKSCVVFGGVSQQPQVKALSQGMDIVIATPGRLLDLINQRYLNLSTLEVFVLDEADRMLDMGFVADIKKVIKLLPAKRQNLFFSATMPREIEKLSHELLTDPVKVEVSPVSSTAEKIAQSVLFVDRANKRNLLRHILQNADLKRVIVFTRTKRGASLVSEVLLKNGISSAAIHGNKSQGARQRALNDFKTGHVRVLVATDIAARGIDVDGVTHVINFELPNIAESYVHRIGRTARAGAEGEAISFCDSEERAYLRDIERLTGQKVFVVLGHPYHSESVLAGPILSKGKAKAMIEGRENGPKRDYRPKRKFRGNNRNFSKKQGPR